MGQCAACLRRKKWIGDEPRCAFPVDGGGYIDDNWNCATINAVRELVYEGQRHIPDGIKYTYCDDMKYATVRLDEPLPSGGFMCLWVSWYKNCGGTDAMWLLDSDAAPRRPTEQDLLFVLMQYGKAIDESF